MASVNDYGKDELANLAAPKLGGTDGWAAAVAAVVNESDVTVDERIYAAIQSSPRGSRWLWGGQDADVEPLPGRIAVESTGGQNRKFAMSNTDADGYGRSAAALIPGDTITVTDDPESPPVTGFARYVIIDDPVEHGTYWTWNALRTDTSGSQSPPAIGTSVRMNATWSGSAGDLYVNKTGDTMTGDLKFSDDIEGLTFTDTKKLAVASGYGADLCVMDMPALSLARLRVGNPTHEHHAATKGYVDGIAPGFTGGFLIQAGYAPSQSGSVTFPIPYKEAPIVVCGFVAYMDGGQPLPAVTIWNQSATGFSTHCRMPSGAEYTGSGAPTWIAIGFPQ